MSALPHGLFTASQIQSLEQAVIQAGTPGILLMKRAGRAALAHIEQLYPHKPPLGLLCGGGNNAGDGYVLAALARAKGWSVQLFYTQPPSQLQADAQAAFAFAQQEQVPMQAFDPERAAAAAPGLWVDALLGLGVRGTVRPPLRAAIVWLNQQRQPVLSLDLPSGLCPDTGRSLGAVVNATHTLCFVALKPGLFTAMGPSGCGSLAFADLGLTPGDYPAASITRLDYSQITSWLPRREAHFHKGHSGEVLVLAGDLGMGGAGLLASEAALRGGAGLVTLATHPAHVGASLARCPEVMVQGIQSPAQLQPLLERAHCVLVGPGLGQSPWSEQLLQAAIGSGKPLVVDADALNLVASQRSVFTLPPGCIITPHPGEAGRLLGCSAQQVQDDRLAALAQLSQRFAAITLLKGAGSLIGDGQTRYLASVGNAALATAGSGDVLGGLIAALWAQGLEPVRATAAAVCIQGEAAARQVANSGLLGHKASDFWSHWPSLLNPQPAI
jgi:ADP-dependent NAD(P)H-hydrate dehydratase / NAD(P)H-hydrate epimerase